MLDVTRQLRQTGPYQLQAAISAEHARTGDAATTDWGRIAGLYQELLAFSDTTVIRLNHAVAVSMAATPEEGLRLLEPLAKELAGFPPYFLAAADMARRAGDMERARNAC